MAPLVQCVACDNSPGRTLQRIRSALRDFEKQHAAWCSACSLEIVAGQPTTHVQQNWNYTDFKICQFSHTFYTYRDLLSVNCRLNSNHKHRFPRFNLFFLQLLSDGRQCQIKHSRRWKPHLMFGIPASIGNNLYQMETDSVNLRWILS